MITPRTSSLSKLLRLPNLGERGVSEALGAAMVLSIFLAAFSAWYPTYARTSVYDSEAKHMEEIRDAFLKLQSGMSLLEKGESMLVNLKMQGEKPRFVPAPGRVGRVVIHGSPQSGIGSLFTESLGQQPCPESLKGEGGGWYELSPLVFLEKFWSLENWEMLPGVDDPNTSSPEWTPLKSATTDGSGSIHVSAFCTDPGSESTESCEWVRAFTAPVGGRAQKVTVRGKLMFATDRGEGLLRIEVEDNGKWKRVYTRSWNQSTNGWIRFENVYQIENSITKIKLYLQARTYTILYDRRADLWADEVCLILGPPYRVEAEYSSSTLGSTGGVEQLTITTLLKTEETSALCTLSIYHPPTGNWEVVKSKTLGPGEEGWEVVLPNPQAYFNSEGRIRLRLRAENRDNFFRLYQDYLKFSLDYKEGRSGGSVEFEIRNSQYPSQTYVYEDGGVILLQDGGGVMLSPPAMLSFVEKTENEVEISVNRYFLVGGDVSLSQSGYVSLKVTLLDSYLGVQAGEKPNRENVVVEIKSPRKAVWGRYLRSLQEELNRAGLNALLDENRNVLTILGRVVESGKKDIYYFERIYEFSVQAK